MMSRPSDTDEIEDQLNPSDDPGFETDLDSESGAEGDSESIPGSAQEANDPLAALQAEVGRWKDTALRTQADFENYRKRMAREKTEDRQYANAQMLSSLLPIIDNFEMGLRAAKDSAGDSIIYQGMHMVHRQMQDFLRDHGAEPVPAEGQDFDPNLHEAVEQRPSGDVPEGKVIAELRPGYRLRDRLLRAANVVVSTGPAKTPTGEAQGN